MPAELPRRVLGSSVRHQVGFGQQIPPELRSPESAWLGASARVKSAPRVQKQRWEAVSLLRGWKLLFSELCWPRCCCCCAVSWVGMRAVQRWLGRGSDVLSSHTGAVLLRVVATGRCSSSRYPRQNPKLVTNSIFLKYPLDTVLHLGAGGRSHLSRAASVRLRGWWTRADGSWEQNSGC